MNLFDIFKYNTKRKTGKTEHTYIRDQKPISRQGPYPTRLSGNSRQHYKKDKCGNK